MGIILVACLATLGVCALFARRKPAAQRATRVTSLDHALVSLINDVSRRPIAKKREHFDRVQLGSRLESFAAAHRRPTPSETLEARS